MNVVPDLKATSRCSFQRSNPMTLPWYQEMHHKNDCGPENSRLARQFGTVRLDRTRGI